MGLLAAAEHSTYAYRLRMGEQSDLEESTRRLFSQKVKAECWKRARPVPGRDPDRWRLDAVGNVVSSGLRGCLGCLCHEYDHIVPFSKGGGTTLDNCQILQTRVNRMKGNDVDDPERQKGYSCARNWSERELDTIEMAVYGDINREGRVCRCKSLAEFNTAWRDIVKVPKRLLPLPDCEQK